MNATPPHTPPAIAPIPPRRRRVLIVTPSFPPINAPDMQRARMSLPYYRDFGWEPHVLALDPAAHGGPREDALLKTVSADIAIHHCGALPLSVSRFLGISNLGLRSWCHLLVAGARIIQREKIDLVFLSNSQFLTFTLGRLWLAWLGVPYVIDLQDPWRTDFYERPGAARPPGGWKYRLARLQARVLEGWSFRRAAALMTVSASYLDDLRRRYRWFHRVPADVIRFGASENDLAIARSLPPSRTLSELPSDSLRLIYTGAAGPIMEPALRVFFEGVALFRQRHPAEASRMHVAFFGTSYASDTRATESVLPIARAAGVADRVSERPQRIGHLESLQLQAQADALIILGSTDPAYSPSKIYPYYLAGRPILAVARAGSVLASTLHELSCAEVVTFFTDDISSDTTSLNASANISAFLENALTDFKNPPLPLRNDALFREQYLARTLTERQCNLFTAAGAADRAPQP